MITITNPDGTWSCLDIDFKEVSGSVYGALCRLHDYEKTGLNPDDVEKINEDQELVHIGSVYNGYRVFGIYNGYCIATNKKAPEPYVVWKIDDDECGVWGGSYCKTREEANQLFAKCAFSMCE